MDFVTCLFVSNANKVVVDEDVEDYGITHF
jgi:hypothetical protein